MRKDGGKIAGKIPEYHRKNTAGMAPYSVVFLLFRFISGSAKLSVQKLKETTMQKERTLSIVKPDAVKKNHIGAILSRFEGQGLKIVAAKMVHLTRAQAEAFYAVHKERPFYKNLVEFMISGPVLVSVLEGENAIAKNRDIMGATDPKKANPGTIRADFAASIDENAVHGSDAADTARTEIMFFFNERELPRSIPSTSCCCC